MADIRGTYDARLYQRFRVDQYFHYMISVLEEMSYASTRYFISSENYNEEVCARFWVKGFKVKVDQDKSSPYFKRARSLVLTNSWPQEAGDMILGLGGHVGICQHRPYHWDQPFLYFTHTIKQARWPCF